MWHLCHFCHSALLVYHSLEQEGRLGGRPRLYMPNHGNDQGWSLEAVVCTRDLRDE